MFALRPIFFEPLMKPLSTPVKLLVPDPDPTPKPTCDNCVSCQLWKELMAICDNHDFRNELPIGILD